MIRSENLLRNFNRLRNIASKVSGFFYKRVTKMAGLHTKQGWFQIFKSEPIQTISCSSFSVSYLLCSLKIISVSSWRFSPDLLLPLAYLLASSSPFSFSYVSLFHCKSPQIFGCLKSRLLYRLGPLLQVVSTHLIKPTVCFKTLCQIPDREKTNMNEGRRHKNFLIPEMIFPANPSETLYNGSRILQAYKRHSSCFICEAKALQTLNTTLICIYQTNIKQLS